MASSNDENRLEKLPNELVENLFTQIKDYNVRQNLSQLNDTFATLWRQREFCLRDEFVSKVGLMVKPSNRQQWTIANKIQAVVWYTSDSVFHGPQVERYVNLEQMLQLRNITNIRIIHESNYENLRLRIFNNRVMKNIKKFSFIDTKNGPFQEVAQDGPNSVKFEDCVIVNPIDMCEHQPQDSQKEFMRDIFKIIYLTINLKQLSIYNSYLDNCAYHILANRNLTVLKLVNIFYVPDRELEYFLSNCKSLKTFFFYVEDDRINKRQLRDSTIEIVYNSIPRFTSIANLKLNAFGLRTPYANILKLKNLQVCTFIVNKFENTQNFRNILPYIRANDIEIYLQNLSNARRFFIRRTANEAHHYRYIASTHSKIMVHEHKTNKIRLTSF